jgi:hypothetical protein
MTDKVGDKNNDTTVTEKKKTRKHPTNTRAT